MGPLGRKIAQYMMERSKNVKVVGAIDTDPELIGKSLKEVCGFEKRSPIKIVGSLKELPDTAKPQVALITTVSDMPRITKQVEEYAAAGLHVVSTCEELSFPWKAAPKWANKIDKFAKKKKVAVLGTGINPGFLMDFLPTTMTALSQRVDKVKVSRIQDAKYRRIPFQKKIGAGLTLKEFEAKRKTGTLRHVGLTESVHMIADRMGWKLEKTVDELSPVVAKKEIRTRAMKIKRGMARGVQQIGRGFCDGEEKITLVFRAAIAEPNPEDKIEIFGEPKIVSSIKGGVNGDVGTCAIAINAVKQVGRCLPGLQTMTDTPVVSYF
jgi:4-hydroxy-tetrahydrodipicolinate reductase